MFLSTDWGMIPRSACWQTKKEETHEKERDDRKSKTAGCVLEPSSGIRFLETKWGEDKCVRSRKERWGDLSGS